MVLASLSMQGVDANAMGTLAIGFGRQSVIGSPMRVACMTFGRCRAFNGG